jgi:hypothetical protein
MGMAGLQPPPSVTQAAADPSSVTPANLGWSGNLSDIRGVFREYRGREPTAYELKYYGHKKKGSKRVQTLIAKGKKASHMAWYDKSGPTEFRGPVTNPNAVPNAVTNPNAVPNAVTNPNAVPNAVTTGQEAVPQGEFIGGSATNPETPGTMDSSIGATVKADPSYEFRLSEGNRAIERSAAARGGLLSGGTGRALTRYNQDYASTEYSNIYNRIAGIAGYGPAANQATAYGAMNYSNNAGAAATNAGYTRASAYVAQGNAWANAINQIGAIDWRNPSTT